MLYVSLRVLCKWNITSRICCLAEYLQKLRLSFWKKRKALYIFSLKHTLQCILFFGGCFSFWNQLYYNRTCQQLLKHCFSSKTHLCSMLDTCMDIDRVLPVIPVCRLEACRYIPNVAEPLVLWLQSQAFKKAHRANAHA